MSRSVYVSRAGGLTIHPAGWVDLPSGARVTRMPVMDGDVRGLFARLGPTPAAAWAETKGYRLPTVAEYDELHRASKYIAPYTLPTRDMLLGDGVPLGDEKAIQRYRTLNMSSRSWCEQHDAEVFDRLSDVGWVNEPVGNAGKHWAQDGVIYGWWLANGSVIQSPSRAHASGGGTHTDYGTTFHVVLKSSQPLKPTKLGDKGEAVKTWQRHLVAQGFNIGAVDGMHGARTEAATKALAQKQNAALPAGKVEHIEARNYTRTTRTSVDLVVLHSTENPIRPGTARSVAQWFAGSSAPQASAHYVVGPDEVLSCVPEAAVAWAAPGANHHGIQIEMVGRAHKTDWLADGKHDDAGAPVMRRAATLVRGICDRWDIPVRRLNVKDLLAGKRGITTHAAVTEAFKKSTHIDPGCAGDQRWPWDEFLRLVRLG